MTQNEPFQHTKSDGTAGPMTIEVDLRTGEAGEPTVPVTDEHPEVQAPPASLEIPPAEPAPARPEWLDPRFKTPEDMAKSYRELETRLGQLAPAKAADPAKPAEAPAAAPAGELTDAELEAYAREVNSTGNLSEASFTALKARGIPRKLAEAHVAGLQAQRAQLMERAVKPFGDAKGYEDVRTWAVSNLTPEAQAQYNADVNSGDPARVQYAVESLKARYDAANGVQPTGRLIAGRRAPSGGGSGFTSMDQQVRAMQDPRYGQDAAYTAEVIRMVERSTGY